MVGKFGDPSLMNKLPLIRRQHRAIERAKEVDDRICHCLDILAVVEARIQERKPGEPTAQDKRGRKELQQRLVKLEAKKRVEEKCFKSFVGYPVVPDLIHMRDMDMGDGWKSISQLRQELSDPLSDQVMDTWRRRVMESYTDEQLEWELLSDGPYYIQGVRQYHGTTEYLLPLLWREPKALLQ